MYIKLTTGEIIHTTEIKTSPKGIVWAISTEEDRYSATHDEIHSIIDNHPDA